MNLHSVVKGAIASINPMVEIVIDHSTGYKTQPDGIRVPQYVNYTLFGQVQAATEQQLEFVSNQGQNEVIRAVWLDGDWSSIVRSMQQGGDRMHFGGKSWLIIQVIETWSQWSHVLVAQQKA